MHRKHEGRGELEWIGMPSEQSRSFVQASNCAHFDNNVDTKGGNIGEKSLDVFG